MLGIFQVIQRCRVVLVLVGFVIHGDEDVLCPRVNAGMSLTFVSTREEAASDECPSFIYFKVSLIRIQMEQRKRRISGLQSIVFSSK